MEDGTTVTTGNVAWVEIPCGAQRTGVHNRVVHVVIRFVLGTQNKLEAEQACALVFVDADGHLREQN